MLLKSDAQRPVTETKHLVDGGWEIVPSLPFPSPFLNITGLLHARQHEQHTIGFRRPSQLSAAHQRATVRLPPNTFTAAFAIRRRKGFKPRVTCWGSGTAGSRLVVVAAPRGGHKNYQRFNNTTSVQNAHETMCCWRSVT
jgi:hypothetical protein